ncbi:hypothetical protein [Asticcacaulis sp.]|uniref:hypothetical protein n=1 Tax=Asticcacaulis sp. TaxID=1872648 RepID=UPI0026279358|nr:hypothetical protein [Asticcacaulis sp.]
MPRLAARANTLLHPVVPVMLDHEPVVVAYGGPKDAKRIRNATGKWPPGHRYEYPLVDWGWDRQRCENEIRATGLPVPVKSACFICAASQEAEVAWLQDHHPDLAAVAVTMEERAHARGLRTVQGLGRRWAWTKFLQERAAQAVRAA